MSSTNTVGYTGSSGIGGIGGIGEDISTNGHCCPDDNEDVMCPQCLLRRLRILSTVNSTRPLGRPTKALPGTKGKIRVLARRFQLGQNLWHPLDRKAE